MKGNETTRTGGRFPLGRVVATAGAIEALAQANVDGRELLSKHHWAARKVLLNAYETR